MGILTSDDKEYLRKYIQYIELAHDKYSVYCDTWDDENYGDLEVILDGLKQDILQFKFFEYTRIEITDPFKEIARKILESIDTSDIEFSGDDDVTSTKLFLVLDGNEGTISVDADFYFIETTYDGTDFEDEDASEPFEFLKNAGIRDNEIITVEYNGGGDDGSLNHTFSNGQTVPDDFEDWCYKELSSNYGGWEIDTGSQGEFVIDFDKKIITLNHGTNEEQAESVNLFKESFIE